jgi:hypothetical protein
MPTITGIVIGKKSEPQAGVKVFVSNYQGKLSPRKIGVVTDANGKFSLDITNKDDDYITASSLEGKTTSKIKPELSNYTLDISLGDERVQQHQEIIIKGGKTPDKGKNYWWIILIGGALIIGITSRIIKRK